MSNTENFSYDALSPFGKGLYEKARARNEIIDQTPAQASEFEADVRAKVAAQISKVSQVSPESVQLEDFISFDVRLTSLTIFRLAAACHRYQDKGKVKTGEKDRVFAHEQELLQYMDELAQQELREKEPMKLLMDMAMKNPMAKSLTVRTREERGFWQRSCVSCAGSGLNVCPRCNGHGEHGCGTCGGHGKVKCSSCKGGGTITCSSCKGSGKGTCWQCGNKGYISDYKEKIIHTPAGPVSQGTQWVSETCPTCFGTPPTCTSCRGKGSWRCDKCSGSGQVQCSTCGGSGKVTCGRCSGSGKVMCDPCAGTGIVHDVMLVSSAATGSSVFFTENFPSSTSFPSCDAEDFDINNQTREFAILGSCQVAVCEFNIIGPEGKKIFYTAWGKREPETGKVKDIALPNLYKACELFTAEILRKSMAKLEGLSIFDKDYNGRLTEITADFYRVPFLAQAIANPAGLESQNDFEKCRSDFIRAFKKLSWRISLPAILIEILLLLPVMPLRDYWLEFVANSFTLKTPGLQAAMPYMAFGLLGLGLGFIAALAKSLIYKKIVNKMDKGYPYFMYVAQAKSIHQLENRQNFLIIFIAFLCSGGIAFCYFFSREIPLWLESGWSYIKELYMNLMSKI